VELQRNNYDSFSEYWGAIQEHQRQEFEKWQEEQSEEYHTREYYWISHFNGPLTIPTSSGFHPWLWKGTESEHDTIIRRYYNSDSNAKYQGRERFNSIEEHTAKYGNPISKLKGTD
jgi:hypothetical protein